MWFQVELAQPTPLTEVQFESSRIGGGRGAGAPPPTAGYPREYVLDVSDDGTNWKTVAKGAGAGVSTAIRFAPVQAKFVRITQTATTEGAPPWSMLRLRLYAAGKSELGTRGAGSSGLGTPGLWRRALEDRLRCMLGSCRDPRVGIRPSVLRTDS